MSPADYRNRFFHLSINERRSLKFVKSSQASSPCQTGSEEADGICLAPLTYDFTISFVLTNRTISMKEGNRALLQVKVREMVMKSRRVTRRLVITSLLALLTPIVLFAPQAYGESYVGGQFGMTMPSVGKGLSDGDLTTTSVPFSTGTLNIPSGTTVDDQSLKNSLMFGGKIGHYFGKARWFGLEAEIFYSTPHIKQQDITFRSSAPSTFTPSGGGPVTTFPPGEITNTQVQGANFHVLTIAPLNFLFRYPGTRLQPYIGVGPASLSLASMILLLPKGTILSRARSSA